MSQKRKFREDDIFDDIVSVNEPSSSATLHGVVTSLSPMKKGKSCEYFDGSLSDETANIRFVGFSTSVRRKPLQHKEKNDPVTLSHCQVQHSRKNDDLEVKLNSATAVKKADKTFDIPTSNPIDSVATIKDMTEYSTVTVEAKVLHIEDPVQLLDGRSKQDLMISDGTQHHFGKEK